MPTLDCTTRRENGVTLVACRLSNGRDVPCRVRLEPAADRIAPPRTEGFPAPGWTEGGYETVVAAGATVGVGFATPDRASDPPATLSVVEEDADSTEDAALEPTATGAARALLDPRPPRDAVSAEASQADGGEGNDRNDGSTVDRDPDPVDGGEVPPVVAAWLARVERRGDRTALRSVAEAVATARRRIDAGEPEP